jgi:hypothetical protein
VRELELRRTVESERSGPDQLMELELIGGEELSRNGMKDRVDTAAVVEIGFLIVRPRTANRVDSSTDKNPNCLASLKGVRRGANERNGVQPDAMAVTRSSAF